MGKMREDKKEGIGGEMLIIVSERERKRRMSGWKERSEDEKKGIEGAMQERKQLRMGRKETLQKCVLHCQEGRERGRWREGGEE